LVKGKTFFLQKARFLCKHFKCGDEKNRSWYLKYLIILATWNRIILYKLQNFQINITNFWMEFFELSFDSIHLKCKIRYWINWGKFTSISANKPVLLNNQQCFPRGQAWRWIALLLSLSFWLLLLNLNHLKISYFW